MAEGIIPNNEKLQVTRVVHTFENISAGAKGYLGLDLPVYVNNNKVVSTCFYTPNISNSSGAQLTAIYVGETKLWVQYYFPNACSYAPVTFSVWYIS